MMFHGLGRMGDDSTMTGSGESDVPEGGSIPGSPTAYETPTYVPPAPTSVYDPVTGDTIDTRTGAIISGPVLGSSGSAGNVPSGNPSTGFNWGSLFGSIVTSASKLTQQAIATPGTTILPNGTVIAGTPQGTSALVGTSSLSSLAPLLLLGGGAVVLVTLLKGKGK